MNPLSAAKGAAAVIGALAVKVVKHESGLVQRVEVLGGVPLFARQFDDQGEVAVARVLGIPVFKRARWEARQARKAARREARRRDDG